MTMTFFHFTHPGHLGSIVEAGRLLPSESNVGAPYPVTDGPQGSHVGPDVVWLLDSPEIAAQSPTGDDLTHGLYPDKRRIRFEVDVRAIRWLDWTHAAVMSPDWRRIMIDAAGGMEFAEHWYVFPAAIRRSRWLGIHDVVLDEPVEV
jgi:hypothetical protein